MLAQDIFNLAMDLMAKRTQTGSIDPTKTAKYAAYSPGLLSLWQNEMAKSGDLYSTFEISNTPVDNMLGNGTGFDIVEYKGITDLIYDCAGQAYAYYFEADKPCTVYIEDLTTKWNTLVTIVIPAGTKSFIQNKGLVAPTSGSTRSRIRVTGGYYARIVNRALFGVQFQADNIPDYRPWVKHQVPIDFKSIDDIIDEYPDKKYSIDSDFKWEGRRDLYISYYYVGNVRVIYKPIPTKITDLSQTIQVDDITCNSGAYFLAAHLLLVEDPSSANFFNQRFEELKAESNIKSPMSIQQIIDFYDITGGGMSG